MLANLSVLNKCVFGRAAARVAAIIGLALIPASASAAVTWSGATDVNWGTTTNWDVAPVEGNDLIFSAPTPLNLPTSNNLVGASAGFDVNSLTFNDSLGNDLAVTGNALDISTGGITMSGGFNVSLGTNLALLGNQIWTNNSATGKTLTASGTVGLGGFNLELAGAGAITLSNAVTTGGPVTLTASSTGIKTLSGGVTGTGNLILNNNGATAGGLTFTTASVNNAGTITNSGTNAGTGTVTITGGVGSNVTGIIQNSTTSALTISTTALTVNGGGTTLTNTAGTKALTVSGGVTGTGNLILNNNSALAQGITFTTASINNAGTITNSGIGAGSVTITGGVGSNVTQIIQNSTTSALTISTTALTVNGGGTTLTNTAGTGILLVSGGVTGTGNLILNNNSATNAGINLGTAGVIDNSGLITNSGTGAGSVTISRVIGTSVTGVRQNSATSPLLLSGVNTYNGGFTLNSGTVRIGNNAAFGTGLATLNGGIVASDGGTGRTVTNSLSLNGTVTFGEATGGTAANTFTGAMTVTGASQIIGVAGVTFGPVGATTMNAALTLAPAANKTMSFLGGITNNGNNLIVNGAGTVGVIGASTLSGTITHTNGTFTIGTAVTLGGNLTLDVASTKTTTISAAIGDGVNTFGLVKDSAGILVLSGVNTYNGGFTLNSGTVRIGVNDVLGVNPAFGGTAGGTLALAGGVAGATISGSSATVNRTIPNPVSLSGTATFGETAFGWTGANTFAGGMTTAAAGSQINAVQKVTFNTAATTMSGALTLVPSNGMTITFSGGFNNNGNALTVTGVDPFAVSSGAVVIDGASTLSGTIFHTNGIFTIGTGAVTLANNLTLDVADTKTTTISGPIGDGVNTFGLVKNSNGTLVLSGANNYDGATTVNAGTLRAATQVSLYNNVPANWTATNIVVANAATLALNVGGTGEFTNSDVATISALAGGFQNGSFLGLDTTNANPISGFTVSANIANTNTMGLTKLGANTLTLTGTNTYTGGTRINGGTLALGSSGALGTSGNITFGGGTLQFSSVNTTDYSSRFTGDVVQNFQVDTNGQNVTFATGLLAAANSLTKLGLGTLTLTDLNSHNGATNVQGGTLRLSGNGQLWSTSTITLSGGALEADNTGTDNPDRISAATINLSGGSLVLKGNAAVDSTESVGPLAGTGGSTVTVSANVAKLATLTASSFDYTTGGATNLVNGVNLGKDSTSTSNVGKIILSTPPTLVGTTAALSTGINAAAKDTQIVPFLLGEATLTTGGAGTATGAANTFVTYEATTGLRPLNPTDEFTNNSIAAGNNIYVTAASTAASSAAVNALVVNGADLSIADGVTLTNTSGALLFASSNAVKPSASSGAISFGADGQVTVNSGLTGTISAQITGANGLIKSGEGVLVLSGTNAYTGPTNVAFGTLKAGASAASKAFGANSAVTLANRAGVTLDLNNFNQIVGSLAGGGTLGGNVSLGSATLTVGTNGTTTAYAGILGGTGGGLTKVGAGTLTLNGANTYTGMTTVSAGTLSFGTANAITGGGGLTLLGGAINNGSGAPLTVATVGPVTLGGDFAFGGTNDLTLSGTTNLTGDRIITMNNTRDLGLGNLVHANSANSTLTVNIGTGSGGAINIASLALSNSANNRTVTFAGTGRVNIAGVISNGGGSTSNLAYAGTGTLTLGGANTYTGNTIARAGTIVLDFSNAGAPASNIISSASKLVFDGSSTVTLKSISGSGAAAGSQTFNGVDINRGSVRLNGDLNNNSNAGTSLSYTLGAISLRTAYSYTPGSGVNSGATTADFALDTLGTGTISASYAPGLTNGILGPWATANSGTDYATISGGNIVALNNAVSALPTSGNNSTANYTINASATLAGALQVNTIRNVNTTSPITIALGANDLTVKGIIASQSIATAAQTFAPLTISGTGKVLIPDELVITGGGTTANPFGNPNTTGADISAPLSGSGTLIKSGNNYLRLYGNNTLFTGKIVLQSGALWAGSGPFGSNYNFGDPNSVELVFFGGSVGLYNGSSDGCFGGSAATVAPYKQTWAGDFTIADSTNNNQSFNLGTGPVTIVNGTRQVSTGYTGTQGTLKLGVNAQGVIGDDGKGYGLIKAGTGKMTLSAANTYSGDTTVIAGTLLLNNTNALQNSTLAGGAGTVQFNTGVSSFTLGGLSGSSNLSLQDTVATAIALSLGNNNAKTTYSGNLSGLGSLTKIGTGTSILAGTNSYGGTTTVNTGTLQMAKTTALVSPTSTTVNAAGTLALNAGGAGEFTNATSGAGSIGDVLANVNWVAGSKLGIDTTNAGGLLTYGAISGAKGLTKLGSGTLNLTAAPTYTGNTTVLAGVLDIDAGLNGNGTGAGTTLVSDGTTTAELFADHVRQTSLTIGDKGKVTITGGGGSSGTSVIGTLTIALPGGGAGNLGGGVTTAVPEPGTLVLLAIAGLLGLLAWRRR